MAAAQLTDSMLPAFEAVIFDMDGLALDTEPTYRYAWRRAASQMGFELSDEFCRTLSGRHADAVSRELEKILGTETALEQFQRLSAEYWHGHVREAGIAAKEGLSALLQLLRRCGIPFALATNSDHAHTFLCLSLARLAREFPHMITRDQVAMGKPAPDIFLEAARRLQTSPQCCLILEDSDTGLEAAARAGGIPILIRDGGGAPPWAASRACRAYASLAEITGEIERWLQRHAKNTPLIKDYMQA
jgi:beta-phosphoglucomutase